MIGEDGPGICERCAIANSPMKQCELCSTADRCIKCRDPFFPTPDKSGCQPPVENCHWDTSKYNIDGEQNLWVCPEC
jgi:hypothetical protein